VSDPTASDLTSSDPTAVPASPIDDAGDPARVVFFEAYPHLYAGSHRAMQLQAGVLERTGHDVRVVTTAEGPLVDKLTASGVATEVVTPPGSLGRYGKVSASGLGALFGALAMPWYWLRLARALRKLRPAVVHVNEHRGLLLALVPAKLARAKVVWQLHSLQPYPRLTTIGEWAADLVMAPSAALVGEYAGLRHPERVVVVAGPPPEPDDPPVPVPSDHRVVSVARLHPDKGVDVLLRAMPAVREAVADAHLVLVGGEQAGWSEYADEMRALIGDLGLVDAVELVDHVDDVLPYVRSARVYVQPSRLESQGLSVLEAMAMGRAVVASRTGGLVAAIEPGVTGELVPVDDAAALAGALIRVLSEPGLAERLGEAATARLRATDPWSAFASGLLAAYGRVLTDR
jgi:glycosyltransferase involved in cell wall biosynthesis